MASLREKTVTGVIWNLAEQITVRGISIFVTLLLAYFLSPEDFGLVAMITVFINIATALMDSGFKQALIKLPDAEQVDFNTAFYANIILGFVAYLLLFFTAPIISDFYAEERLTALIRVAGLVVIINVFQVVQYACLSRALNFRVQFRAALPASIISALVAIAMAYSGFGVWALIAQMLVSAAMVIIFLWWQYLWRPTLSWSLTSLKSMYQFGYKLFLADLLDVVFRNLYVVVIAKTFSVSIAGLYFFADKIKELLILRVVTSIQNVTYPALVKVGSSDGKLKSGYKKLIIFTSFALSPLVLFLAGLAEPLFILLLADKWLPASHYLQLMCIAGVLIPMHALNLNILKVKGRSDLSLIIEIVKKILLVAILVVSINYGVTGILYGQIISSILALGLNSYFSGVLISYRLEEQLVDFIPNIMLSGLIAYMLYEVYKLQIFNELVIVFLFGPLAILVYLVSSFVLKLEGLRICSDILSNNLNKKFRGSKNNG
ncbi:lipopolysaccharide biosynthesis protein [Methylophaga sp.]|uniref:lipopolysaccharide biosynthesis protein n=1 Tax=Methylophaga sp. TaxID=2024840 RepID=UPI001400A1E7|nr:lipopolysaccharide biosynthesis protein [Methylophaga sp.]MTI64681.1 lipopolysaccharide biosynthesis protein [Methylophaga sp.]